MLIVINRNYKLERNWFLFIHYQIGWISHETVKQR